MSTLLGKSARWDAIMTARYATEPARTSVPGMAVRGADAAEDQSL